MYKRYTKDDLSFLDMACLMAAITVIYKVVAGTAPYPASDAATQALIVAPDFATIQSLLAPTPPPATAEPMQMDSAPLAQHPSPAQVWGFCANLSAGLSAPLVLLFTSLKMGAGDNPPPVIGVGHAVSYVPYCMPDFGVETNQEWYAILNEVITYSSILKNGYDIYLCKGFYVAADNEIWQTVSPYLDVAISVAWFVPTIADVVVDHSPGGVVNFVGNVGFNSTAFFSLAYSLLVSNGDPSGGVLTAAAAEYTFNSILLYGAAMTTDAFVVGFSKNSWT